MSIKRNIICTMMVVMVLVSGLSITASAKTYKVDEQKYYTLTGKVKKHNVNYDERHHYTSYDLILDKKVKLRENNFGRPIITKTKKLMIVFTDLSDKERDKIKKLAGKKTKIKIKGNFRFGLTGWYCETYAICAKKIKIVKK